MSVLEDLNRMLHDGRISVDWKPGDEPGPVIVRAGDTDAAELIHRALEQRPVGMSAIGGPGTGYFGESLAPKRRGR